MILCIIRICWTSRYKLSKRTKKSGNAALFSVFSHFFSLLAAVYSAPDSPAKT